MMAGALNVVETGFSADSHCSGTKSSGTHPGSSLRATFSSSDLESLLDDALGQLPKGQPTRRMICMGWVSEGRENEADGFLEGCTHLAGDKEDFQDELECLLSDRSLEGDSDSLLDEERIEGLGKLPSSPWSKNSGKLAGLNRVAEEDEEETSEVHGASISSGCKGGKARRHGRPPPPPVPVSWSGAREDSLDADEGETGETDADGVDGLPVLPSASARCWRMLPTASKSVSRWLRTPSRAETFVAPESSAPQTTPHERRVCWALPAMRASSSSGPVAVKPQAPRSGSP